MKALTIWQPWASLIAWGEKSYETRSWPTRHRGPLAIHAGAYRDGEWKLVANIEGMTRILERHRVPMRSGLPHGAVLCIVELVDVFRTELIKGLMSEEEKRFGDFADGRYAWELKVIEVFTAPHTQRGRQGLWNWEIA